MTDVGSVKRDVIAALGSDSRFVGGHPLAGAETVWRRERARRPLRGRPLVPDPDPEDRRGALRPGPAGDRRARRQAAGDRGRDPRPPDGHGQPSSARARQRARHAGRDGAQRGGRAPSRGRPELPRRHPGGGRESGDLGRHLRRQPRGGRGGDRRSRSPGSARRPSCSAPASAMRSPPGTSRPASRRRELIETEIAGGPLHELRVLVPNRPGIVAEVALELGRAGVNIEDMALYPAARHDLRSDLALHRRRRARRSGPRALVRELGHDVSRVAMRFEPAGPLHGRAPAAAGQVGLPPGRADRRDGRGPDQDQRLPRLRRHAGDAAGRRGRRSGGEGGRARRPRRPLRRGRGHRAARPAPGGDRRRERGDPAAPDARVAGRAGRGRVDLRRRRVDSAPPGRPDRRAAAA